MVACVAAMVVSSTNAFADTNCPDGQSMTADTDGHCCWAGQVWSDGKCIGAPTSCPKGFAADEDRQSCVDRRPKAAAQGTCDEGMISVKSADGAHCCWPGQAWSTTRQTCVGMPTSCPSDYVPYRMPDCKGGAEEQCGEACVYYKIVRDTERDKAQEQELNRRCGSRPAAAAPASEDTAWGTRRLLCSGMLTTLASELLKDTHPSGKSPRVVGYQVVNNERQAIAIIKFEWSGGLSGARYTTTVEWALTTFTHVAARVVADSAPFAVDAAHARLLDDYFRYQAFPAVDQITKRPRPMMTVQ